MPSELQSFEDFLLSLRPAANPRALLSRQLPVGLTLHGEVQFGRPRVGSELFAPSQNPNGGPATCNTCHALPTGGSGSIVADNSVTLLRLESRNATLEAVQLSNFLTPRDQPLVEVQVALPGGGPIGPVVQPLLGHGWLHAGNMPSLADFMERRFATFIDPTRRVRPRSSRSSRARRQG